MAEAMIKERPYAANYAVALLIVLGIDAFFFGVCDFILPELTMSDSFWTKVELSVICFVSFVLAIGVYVGIPFFHKAAVVLSVYTLVASIILIWYQLDEGRILEVDDCINLPIAVGLVVLLLTPSCREYYRGSSLKRNETE